MPEPGARAGLGQGVGRQVNRAAAQRALDGFRVAPMMKASGVGTPSICSVLRVAGVVTGLAVLIGEAPTSYPEPGPHCFLVQLGDAQ